MDKLKTSGNSYIQDTIYENNKLKISYAALNQVNVSCFKVLRSFNWKSQKYCIFFAVYTRHLLQIHSKILEK